MVSKIYATMANDKTDIAMVEDSIYGSSGILHQKFTFKVKTKGITMPCFIFWQLKDKDTF